MLKFYVMFLTAAVPSKFQRKFAVNAVAAFSTDVPFSSFIGSSRRKDTRQVGRRNNDVKRFSSTKSDDSVASPGEGKPLPKTKNSRKRITKQTPVSPEPSAFPDWAFEKRDFFKFELLYESKKSMARVGRIHTPHGIIDTPSYVAVATNGALKGLDMRDADDAGQQLVFCNSYHLLLQPGPEVIEEAGGLHTFMKRNKPLITDSGGFQVFSLAYGSVHEERSSGGELKRSSRKKNGDGNMYNSDGRPPVTVSEEGVMFKSYRDGRKIFLTPESTVQAQKSYGADIIIPLDELPPHHTDRERLVESVDLTHRWEARSLQEHLRNVKDQAMYCVIHGGLDVELRKKSVEYLTSLPFDGYSIGGSLGKNANDLKVLLQWMMPMFNEGHRRDKPRHLLGIADEGSILNAITMGIDSMDSCYPTRLSRHGTLLTREGSLQIKSGKHKTMHGVPIDPECSCSTCQHYDRPYLWHLFKAKEPLFMQLATLHNLHYMNDLMARQRQGILDGKI